jgi:predicted class III extradiol MEMO1 family dioxygenase
MAYRAASHSGSWYSDDRGALTHQLDQWLAQVPDAIEGVGSLPVPGARIIIAPYVLDLALFIVRLPTDLGL